MYNNLTQLLTRILNPLTPTLHPLTPAPALAPTISTHPTARPLGTGYTTFLFFIALIYLTFCTKITFVLEACNFIFLNGHTNIMTTVTATKKNVNSLALFAQQKHPFHILGPSKFPFFTGLTLFCWLVPQVFYLHGLALPILNNFRSDIIHLSFVALFITIMSWFLSVIKELAVVENVADEIPRALLRRREQFKNGLFTRLAPYKSQLIKAAVILIVFLLAIICSYYFTVPFEVSCTPKTPDFTIPPKKTAETPWLRYAAFSSGLWGLYGVASWYKTGTFNATWGDLVENKAIVAKPIVKSVANRPEFPEFWNHFGQPAAPQPAAEPGIFTHTGFWDCFGRKVTTIRCGEFTHTGFWDWFGQPGVVSKAVAGVPRMSEIASWHSDEKIFEFLATLEGTRALHTLGRTFSTKHGATDLVVTDRTFYYHQENYELVRYIVGAPFKYGARMYNGEFVSAHEQQLDAIGKVAVESRVIRVHHHVGTFKELISPGNTLTSKAITQATQVTSSSTPPKAEMAASAVDFMSNCAKELNRRHHLNPDEADNVVKLAWEYADMDDCWATLTPGTMAILSLTTVSMLFALKVRFAGPDDIVFGLSTAWYFVMSGYDAATAVTAATAVVDLAQNDMPSYTDQVLEIAEFKSALSYEAKEKLAHQVKELARWFKIHGWSDFEIKKELIAYMKKEIQNAAPPR